MTTTTDWEHLSTEVNQDRRGGTRIPLVFPLEVAGFDRTGHFFTERTATADVSAGGCRFRLKAEVSFRSVVALKVVSRSSQRMLADRPLLFEIAWVKRDGEGWLVGAEKMQPDDIWCVAFPSTRQEATTVSAGANHPPDGESSL